MHNDDQSAPPLPFGTLLLFNPLLFWSAVAFDAMRMFAASPTRTDGGRATHDLPVPDELSRDHEPELFA